MDALEPPSTDDGWAEDPAAPPHLVLRSGFDEVRNATLVTVEGRTVLALPASGDSASGLLRAVDLATGTELRDRALLRYERHEVLALGAGRLLATLGRHRDTVVVRDAVTGMPAGVPIREKQQTRSLTLTMAGERPAVVTTGSGLAVWDVATGALIGRHERLRGRHFATYRGRLLLVAEESARSLRLYDVLTGEPFGHPLPCDFCLGVSRLSAVEHDGRLLVAFLDGHADTRVSLWDATAGVELPTTPPADDVRDVGLATVNGRPLLLAGRSGRSGSPMTLWDPVAGREMLPDFSAGYDGACTRVMLGSLDDGFFAVTVDGGSAQLWVRSPEGTRRRALPDGGVWQAAIGPIDGRPTVAVGGSYGNLRLFDVRTGQEFSSPFYGGPVNEHIIGTMAAGGARVILNGRPMRVWDVAAGVPVARLNRSADDFTGSAAGELDGRSVLAMVAATGLRIWDPAADVVIADVSLAHLTGDTPPGDVAFTEIDGRTAVSVVIGRTVHTWDAATGEPLGRPYRGVATSIRALAAGRIGDRPVLAVAGKDPRIHVFDAATGAPVGPPLTGHSQTVTALAIGPSDGRTVVVSSGYDNTVRAWDAATGASVGGPWNGHVAGLQVTEWNGEPVVLAPPRMWRLRAPAGPVGHTDAVHAVAAGRWEGRPVFASGSADRTVRLWDAAGGRPLGPALGDHTEPVTHVAFTGPERDILITGDESGVVLRWQSHGGTPHSEPLARTGKQITGIGTADVDGRTVVGVGTADGAVRTWDAVTSAPHAELHPGTDVAVSRMDLGVLDGRVVALTMAHGGDDDGSVLTLWDVLTGEPLYAPTTVPEESADLGTLATMDGRLVVIRGIDALESGGTYHPEDAADVHVIDVATRTVLRRHRHKRGWSGPATVARSGRGTVVVVAAEDGVVVMDPVEDFEYAGHGSSVTCVAAAEVEGRTIVASGDRGNGLHFWDLSTRERLGVSDMRSHSAESGGPAHVGREPARG